MKSGPRLGAELGATWLRLALADESGKIVKRARLPGALWPQAPELLRAALRRWGSPRLEALTLGGKGLWHERARRALRPKLRDLARRVTVMSDLELSHRAAFAGGPGVLLIAGTGSAALGRDARGRLRRAGGWGPLLGDEGSAFWLGREALREPALARLWPEDLPLRLAADAQPVRAVASLARQVLARAKKGDAAAQRLRARAARELARLALEASKGLAAPVPLVLHGGLFADRLLAASVLAALGGRFRAQRPMLRAEDAAARLD